MPSLTGGRAAGLLHRELRLPPTELALRPLDDGRMHLADTALREIQGGPDLLHREFLVVVEDDDQPFIAIEALGHQSH